MSETTNSCNNTASIWSVDNLRLDGNTLSSTNTNGNIVLAPNGTGDVSVTAASIVPSTDRADSLGSSTNSWDNVYADGITFDDGTNILGNYLNFTSYTPVLNFGGGTTGIVYGTQIGFYTRIGNIILFSIYIGITSKGTSTGIAKVNLPVACDSGAGVLSYVCSSNYINYTYPQLTGTINNITDSDNIYFYNEQGSSARLTLSDSEFTDISNFNITGWYPISL